MIELKELCFSYEKQPLIQNLTFHLESGDTLLIRGSNGSGKTTLLKILANRLKHDSGLVSIPLNYTVAYIPVRTNGLYDRLSGRENIDLFSTLLKINIDKRIQNWSYSTVFEKALETPFKKCSVGMKQILNIFILTLNSPDLILADEIFKPFDPETKNFVRDMILSEFKDKIKVFITHDDFKINAAKTIHEDQWS
jgi:ABC-type multidrug transport system ATPase subunit